MTKINILGISEINILLLILVILIIYGYFFSIKNKQVINIFENFNSIIDGIEDEYKLVDNETDIENIKDNIGIPLSRMPNYANGTWLTNNSKIENNKVINTMDVIILNKIAPNVFSVLIKL